MKSGGRGLARWASAESLWIFPVAGTCCAQESLHVESCRYDLERLGCVFQDQPEHADLLLVMGVVPETLATELKAIYDRMRTPKYVMALGACACSGGLFAARGLDAILPVDLFVPGCPPRPEAIMHGILKLKASIRGHEESHPAH